MFNRRFYERIDINVDCVLFLNAGEVMETSGLLRDISESGIGLLMKKTDEMRSVLKEGLELQFQFGDSFQLFGELTERVVASNARVVRIMEHEDGIEVGCIILRTDKVEDYIRERKIAQYLGTLQNIDT